MGDMIGVAWFTSNTTVGIVMTVKGEEKKAYIKSVAGQHEGRDINIILETGAKFPIEEAESIIDKNGSWKPFG